MTPITVSFIVGDAVLVVIIMISGYNIRQDESWPALPKYGECVANQTHYSINLRPLISLYIHLIILSDFKQHATHNPCVQRQKVNI